MIVNPSERPAKQKDQSPDKRYLRRLKIPVIIVLTLIWLAIALTGGYFINEAATDKFRNDIIETDLKYFEKVLKSITVINNLTKEIEALIVLNEKKEIEAKVNESNIKHIDGFKGVMVYDMENNIIFQSAPDFTPSKEWKAIYADKGFKIDAYSDNEIIIKISSEARFSDISVGKAIIILSVPLPEHVSAQLQTIYVVWLSVIIILFLLILFIVAKFKIETKPKDKNKGKPGSNDG